MKKTAFLLLILLTTPYQRGLAQFSLAWCAEIQDNYYTVSDPNNHLRQHMLRTAATGIDVQYSIKKWNFISGVHSKSFNTAVTFIENTMAPKKEHGLQIPLLLGRSFYFYKKKLSLNPYIGSNLFFIRSISNTSHDFFIVPDTVIFQVVQTSVLLNNFSMTAAAGLQLNIHINKHFVIGTYIAYNKGFRTLLQQNVRYSVGSGASTLATKSDNATFFSRWAIRLHYNS